MPCRILVHISITFLIFREELKLQFSIFFFLPPSPNISLTTLKSEKFMEDFRGKIWEKETTWMTET
jgi:hypothetical protein